MKLSQVKVKDLVVGALVIAAEAPSSMRLLELINFPLDVPEGATHIAFFKDGESAQYVAFENGVGMFPAFAMVTYYPCNRFDV